MKFHFSFLFLIFTLLVACHPEPTYVDVSTFDIDNSHVQNLDKISLIYSSETPAGEPELSYFLHTLGINERTKDTLNILTTFNRGGGNGDMKNEFIFYTFESAEGKEYFDNLYNTGETSSHKIAELYEIERVLHDKRFDFITNNGYETVTGFIDKE